MSVNELKQLVKRHPWNRWDEDEDLNETRLKVELIAELLNIDE